MAPQSVARGALRSRDRAAAGMPRPRLWYFGTPASRYGVASSFGSYCSALRGRIRVVAFRASHPAKPPSRQRRFVQRLSGRPRNRVISGQFIPDHTTSDCLPGHITLTL